MFFISVVYIVLIILFHKKTVQCDCGERLGKGVVMCQFEVEENIDPFDFKLCTHVNIGTNTFKCDANVCWPNNSTDFELLVKWVLPQFPKTVGFRVDFDQAFIDVLSSRSKRLNTAKRLIKFLEERGMSFLFFTETTTENSFKNTLDRNSLLFITEIARAVHERGWHIGLALDVGVSELQAQYDFTKLSLYVDWFRLFPVKVWTDEKYMQPFLPVASNIDPVGTTEYWIKHVLQWLKPECLLLHVHIVGIKYTAKETAVSPGPGSLAAKDSRKIISMWDLPKSLVAPSGRSWKLANEWGMNDAFLNRHPQPSFRLRYCVLQLCETIALTSCGTFWDDDSGTPWASCGDDYYSYVDPRSVELRTELARQYGIAGMSILGNILSSGSSFCGHEDDYVYFKALQSIRNITE